MGNPLEDTIILTKKKSNLEEGCEPNFVINWKIARHEATPTQLGIWQNFGFHIQSQEK
jgi:hypothetical protein